MYEASMFKKFICLILPAAMAIITFTGCAGDKYYKEGQTLLENSQYDLAVDRLTQAVKLAQKDDNEKLLEKYNHELSKAQIMAAEYYYNQAQTYLEKTELDLSQKRIEKALSFQPQNQKAIDFKNAIDNKIQNVIALKNQAVTLNSSAQYDQAVKTMEQALHQWASFPDGNSTLTKLKRDAFSHHLAQANNYLDINDLDQAKIHCQQALQYQSPSPQIQSILNAISNRRQSYQLVTTARQKIDQGLYQPALDLLEQAKRLYPTQTGLDELIAQTKKNICDINITQGQNLLTSQQYAAALKCFYNSNSLLPGYSKVNDLIEQTSEKLADEHLATADGYEKKQLYGNALLNCILANEYSSNNSSAKNSIARYANVLKQQTAYSIAFAGVTGTNVQANTLKKLQSDSLQYLLKAKPQSISILNFAGTQDESAVLYVEILEKKILLENTSKNATSTYIGGTQQVVNPDYEKACKKVERSLDKLIDKLDDLDRTLDRHCRDCPDYISRHSTPTRRTRDIDHRRIDRNSTLQSHHTTCECESSFFVRNARTDVAQAERELWAAEVKRDNIPQLIAVPLEMQYTYPVYTYTKTAHMKCTLQLLDTQTSNVLYIDTVTADYTVKDRFVQEDSSKNVPGDTLNLPDDERMFQNALDQLQTKINKSLNIALQQPAQKYLTNTATYNRSKNTEKTIENAFLYIYSYPLNTDANQKIIACINDSIGIEKELVNIHQLLKTHCNIP